MTHRLGKRVIHFANLPIKLLMPTRATNIDEIALKTIPSASKVEIKNVLESLYGFQVAEVRTLNMEGKKKKRGGILLAKPDYKKAYVTLRRPLSINPDLFPFRAVAEARAKTAPKSAGASVVEDAAESESRKHWLHGRMVRDQQVRVNTNSSSYGRGYGGSKLQKTRAGASSAPPRVPSLPRSSPPRSSASSPRRGGNGGAKFPWSSMRSSSPSSFGRGYDGAKFPWSSMKSKFNSGSR